MGPLPRNLKPEASEVVRLAEARVLRVLEAWGGSFARVLRVLAALGCSFVRILRVREVPGGLDFNHAKTVGGSLPKNLRPEVSEALRLAGWLDGT